MSNRVDNKDSYNNQPRLSSGSRCHPKFGDLMLGWPETAGSMRVTFEVANDPFHMRIGS